jgi:hypothetical protein
MGKRRKATEPLSMEEFEKDLREELSVSAEFDLPLSLLVAVKEGGWDRESTRRILDTLRAADLITSSRPDELAIALPNTGPEPALSVERRLRAAVPEVAVGIATRRKPQDALPELLRRARGALKPPEA